MIFKDELPVNTKMRIELTVGLDGAGQRVEFAVGDGVVELDLPAAGQVISGNFSFNNSMASNSLKLRVPAGGAALAMVSLEILE